jgi:hypothetical protein
MLVRKGFWHMYRSMSTIQGHTMTRTILHNVAALVVISSLHAAAQSPTDLVALKGLAPVTVLANSSQGRAALAANYSTTGGIQTGAVRQATLLPFPDQQQQALRDAFVTDANIAELADGLGTTLGGAYLARAHYIDRFRYTSLSPAVAELIAYADSTTAPNSNAAKFFFANATSDGKIPVSVEAAAILKDIHGNPDAFGKYYGLPAGSPGANPFGDSRPFQTEPSIAPIVGPDYFNTPADNAVYNRGPIMNLVSSPSYPSGHTVYGYMGSLLLAVLIPQRYQQMITRGAEYGNDRILMGAHYTMDVLGGRTLATYDLAHLLANDPAYLGRSINGRPPLKDFRVAVKAARADVIAILQTSCGKSLDDCAREDTGRLSNPAANEAFYASTQTYNLPVVYPEKANTLEDVAKRAPEAGYLLTVAFPTLTLDQANRILTETEGPGGGFLDDGSCFGIYSRLNLYAAAGRAATIAAEK